MTKAPLVSRASPQNLWGAGTSPFIGSKMTIVSHGETSLANGYEK